MGYNIGPTIAVKGESEYGQALAKIKANMRLISSEAAVMTAEFGKNEKSVGALRQKGQLLSDALAQQEKAAQEAENALMRMRESGVDPSSTAYVDMQTNLNNAKAAMAGTRAEISANEQELKQLENSARGAGVGAEDLGEKWQSFAKGAGTAALTSLKAMGIAMGAIATAAVAAAKAIWELGTKSGQWADELLTTSAQTDVSVKTLQEWAYAARFVDTEVGDMTKGMSRVVAAMRSSTDAGKDYIEMSGGMRISMLDANGSLKSTEQIFYDSIDALGAMEDATLRDIAAQDLFGKSYQDMKPLIEAGSDALLRYAAEAHDAGLILSDEAVAALGKFDDQMQRMQAQLETVGRLAAVIFLPALSGIANGVTTVLSTITTALSDGFQASDIDTIAGALSTQLQAAIDAVGEHAPAFIGILTKVLSTVINGLVELLPDLLPVLANAAIGLMTSVLTTLQTNAQPLADTVVQLVMMFVNFLLQNLPMIAQTGLDILVALMTGIAEQLPALIPAIVDVILQIVAILTDPENLSALITASIAIIMALVQGLIAALPDLVMGVVQIVGNLVTAFIDNAPKLLEAGRALFDELKTGLADAIVKIYLSIGGWITTYIWQPVQDKVKDFFKVGQNLLVGLWNGINDKVDWLKRMVGGVVDKIKSWFTGKNGFVENSPSKWAEGVGDYVMQGMSRGFSGGLADTLATASAAIGKLKSTLTISTPDVSAPGAAIAGAGAGASGALTINQYIQAVPQTAVELADQTAAMFARARWGATA